jgi:hypothetical protein
MGTDTKGGRMSDFVQELLRGDVFAWFFVLLICIAICDIIIIEIINKKDKPND